MSDNHKAMELYKSAVGEFIGENYQTAIELLSDAVTLDVEMVTYLTNRNHQEFANDNNVWRSHLLKVEDAIETELQR